MIRTCFTATVVFLAAAFAANRSHLHTTEAACLAAALFLAVLTLRCVFRTRKSLRQQIARLEKDLAGWEAGARIDHGNLRDYIRAMHRERSAKELALKALEEAVQLTTRQAEEIGRLRKLLQIQ